MESIVRLAALRISNIKNVADGRIIMPHVYRRELIRKTAEILGIYGQNGSGKTTVIDALYYLHQIMIGEVIPEEIVDYLDVNSDHTKILADFHIYESSFIYEVTYALTLKSWEKSARIVQETLSCAVNDGDKRSNKTVFI